jgi:hypothetical protein
MSIFSKTILKPFGVILASDQVKHVVIVNELAKCGDNYVLSSATTGQWENNDLSVGEDVQLSAVLGAGEGTTEALPLRVAKKTVCKLAFVN